MPTPIKKLWVFPPKYWAATERMTEDEKERIIQKILDLAERGDTQALKQFDFLSFEESSSLREKSATAGHD
jgi:hypothetical protein